MRSHQMSMRYSKRDTHRVQIGITAAWVQGETKPSGASQLRYTPSSRLNGAVPRSVGLCQEETHATQQMRCFSMTSSARAE